MNQDQINEILEKHKKWLNDEEGGECANFSGINLRGANFSGVNLRGANFSGANLRGANFSDADLHGANFSYADLRNADLRGANFSRANLRGANFSGADLRRADLRDADLRGANFSGADLRGADFSGADLRGADFRGAEIEDIALNYNPNVAGISNCPIYQVAGVGEHKRSLTVIAQGEPDDWRWFAGCFSGSESELRRAIQSKYGSNDQGYTLAIDFLKALATQREQ